MRRALELAARAQGDTSPNPMVGAVLVKRGRIIAEGYHRQAGLPHAEIEALNRARRRAEGATLYVSLEPCAHDGRTPPCCDAVVAAKPARVVVAMRDPNPKTNGRGISALRRAGVRVAEGVLQAEARHLNRAFAKTISTGLPWVIAKIAQSLDGKIATRTGASHWISSEASRLRAHHLRRQVDAVVVGIQTVLNDNPALTARVPGRPARAGRPLAVILDSRLQLPLSSRCLRQGRGRVIVATTVDRPDKAEQLAIRGAEVVRLPATTHGRVPLRPLLRLLASRHGVTSVLVEGGAEVMGSLFDERLVDEVVWFIAPQILGGRKSPSSVAGFGVAKLEAACRLTGSTVELIGGDVMIRGVVQHERSR